MDLSEVVGRPGEDVGRPLRLKIMLSPGQEPLTLEVPPTMTVDKMEAMLARKLSRRPENIRLCFRSKPLERSLTAREVADMIGPEGVLENIPAHTWGE